MQKLIFLGILIIILACQDGRHKPFINHKIKIDSTLFEHGMDAGGIKNNRIEEASGMTFCRTNPQYYWTINDSGGNAEVYLMNVNGEFAGTLALPQTIANRDWEEIASYTDKKTNQHYLYIGDIGDNRAIYPTKMIYRVEAPIIGQFSSPLFFLAKKVEKISFQFSDKVRDSEAFLIDPETADFYVFSKREDTIQVYFTPSQNLGKENVKLQKIGRIPARNVTAADITTDGQEILLKDYDNIYYWKRKKDEKLANLFNRLPVRLPYKVEPQGEAIAWLPNKKGFYTLSELTEKDNQRLYFYKRK